MFSAGLAVHFGDRVIILSADDHGWPYGIGLPTLPASLSKQWVGMAAGSSATSLVVEAASLLVDLADAVVWDGRRALGRLSPSPVATIQGAQRAREYRVRRLTSAPFGPDHPGGIAGALEAQMASSLRRLTRGLRLHDRTMWIDGALALLGLGPGLTPAGDDVLSGLMLAFHSCRHNPGALTDNFVELIDLVRQRTAGRTTLYGASALYAAASGEAPEVIVNALEALYRDPSAVSRRLDELVAVGATSGLDMLMGLSAGLDLLADASPPA